MRWRREGVRHVGQPSIQSTIGYRSDVFWQADRTGRPGDATVDFPAASATVASPRHHAGHGHRRRRRRPCSRRDPGRQREAVAAGRWLVGGRLQLVSAATCPLPARRARLSLTRSLPGRDLRPRREGRGPGRQPEPSPPWIRFYGRDRPPAASAVLAGAGDIAECNNPGDEATADLLDGIGGTVFTAGDNVYPDGTAEQFDSCYQPSWGRHLARTHSAAGDHDYRALGAAGYYDYFSSAAGDPAAGYSGYEPGRLARRRAEQQLRPGGLHRRVGPGAVAAQDLSASADVCAVASGATACTTPVSTVAPRQCGRCMRRCTARCRAGPQRPRPPLRALRAPEPDGNLNSSFGIRQVTVGTGGRGPMPSA